MFILLRGDSNYFHRFKQKKEVGGGGGGNWQTFNLMVQLWHNCEGQDN